MDKQRGFTLIELMVIR
ncbi:TPA: prepilin-type N-terminal cleavage/methylation domain-containing protein [Klebsiella michiganensis]|nr:prepilin-type N-terminal cleavage/methylation domain-containing protein [Klebsiella michiganensis]